MSGEKDAALKSIFKGGSIVFLGLIVQKFLGLAYRLIVGRGLGAEVYGVISVMASVYAIGSTLGSLGMSHSVQKFVSSSLVGNNVEDVRGTIRSGLIIVTPLNLVMFIILFFGAGWISKSLFNEPNLILPIKMLAFAIPLSNYTNILSNIPDAYEKMEFNVVINNFWPNTTKVIISIFAILLGYKLSGVAFAYAFSMGSGIILSIYFSQKLVEGGWIRGRANYNFRELFSFSWPLIFSSIFSTLVTSIDTMMIQSLIGTKTTGLYSSAYPLAAFLTIGGTMFGSIFLSNASKLIQKGKNKELATVYSSLTKWILITTLPLLFIFLAFPRAVLTIFGSEYYSAANTLRILSVGFAISAVSGPFGKVFQAVDRTKLIFWNSLVLITLSIILNLVLIPVNGLEGAAFASTMSFTGSAIFSLYFMKRDYEIIPFRISYIKIFISALVATLATYQVSNMVFEVAPLWFFAVDLIFFGIIYLISLLALRTLEQEDKMIIKRINEKKGFDFEKLDNILDRFS